MRTQAMTKNLLLLAAALAVGGCSLWVKFDPNGKPCGAGDICLPGFECIADQCVKGAAVGDGGTVAGADAGATDECGGKCTGAQKCLKVAKKCAEGCDALICSPGSICANGTVACALLTDKTIGSRCQADTDCPAGPAGKPAFCLVSSVTVDEGGPKRYGLCTQRCDADADCGGAAGVACFDINGSDGVPIKLCLRALDPKATAAAGNVAAVVSCHTDADCAERGGTCAVFDQKTAGLAEVNAPLLLCNIGRVAGLPIGAPCDTSLLIASNGICPPGHAVTTKVPPVVSEPCRSDADCPGRVCITNSEFAQPGFLPRLLDLCGSKDDPRNCLGEDAKCSSDAECSPNLPHCLVANPASPTSPTTKRCMAECAVVTAGLGKLYGCDADKNCKPVPGTTPSISVCVRGGTCNVQ